MREIRKRRTPASEIVPERARRQPTGTALDERAPAARATRRYGRRPGPGPQRLRAFVPGQLRGDVGSGPDPPDRISLVEQLAVRQHDPVAGDARLARYPAGRGQTASRTRAAV